MMNEEDAALIGFFGFEHDFQQPFGRAKLFGVTPELPGRDLFERQFGHAADLQERIVANGIERLDPAIEQDWKAAELANVELAIFFGHQDGDDVRREEREQEPGENFE